MNTQLEARRHDWAGMVVVFVVGLMIVVMLYAFWAAPPKIEASPPGQNPGSQVKQEAPVKHIPANHSRPYP